MDRNFNVLVADDEKEIISVLRLFLEKENINVYEAYDGEMAYMIMQRFDIDLAIIDIMMPRMNGYELLKKLRVDYDIPVMIISAKVQLDDKVIGLELGADDYITKPYSARELTARVRANLRRSAYEVPAQAAAGSEVNTVVSGDLTINIERYEVTKNGETVDITLREFELLKFLATQPDKIFSREKLLENVWGYEYYGDVRTVDVTVRRLREKIEDDPSMPKYIITKRGVGYYFNK